MTSFATTPLSMKSHFSAPALSLQASMEMARAGQDPKAVAAQKAKIAAQDFESVFINSMVSQMFTAIGGEGPFGAGAGAGVWRSFLSEEYSKSFAKSGGIGMADHVYGSLLAQQEAQMRP